MYVRLLSIALLLLAATFVGSSLISSHAKEISASAPEAPPMQSARWISSPTDMRGARYLAPNGDFLTIEETAWGVTAEGDLAFAFLAGTFEDGSAYVHAPDPAVFSTIVSSTEELPGVHVETDDGRYRIDAIKMAVDGAGNIVIPYLVASREVDGQQVVIGEPHGALSAVGNKCCAVHEVPSGCTTACETPCPDNWMHCDCTGDGVCVIRKKLICRGYCNPPDGCPVGSCPQGIGQCFCH